MEGGTNFFFFDPLDIFSKKKKCGGDGGINKIGFHKKKKEKKKKAQKYFRMSSGTKIKNGNFETHFHQLGAAHCQTPPNCSFVSFDGFDRFGLFGTRVGS